MKMIIWATALAILTAGITSTGQTSAAVKTAPSAPSPVLEKKFRKIAPTEIPGNIIAMVSKEWMLVSAGTPQKFNSMTAGWGGIGVMWSKPVAFILVRNTRYTFGFLEREPYFTLTFFDRKYKPQLLMFGTRSGRNTDKLKESGFTPLDTGFGMAYEQARLIIACKKIYGDRIKGENAVAPPKSVGNEKDYHKLYFGEIVGVWIAR